MDERFLIRPEWPAPARVRALVTTRNGGVSTGDFSGWQGGGLNLGTRCGDETIAVATNRARLRQLCPSDPVWLHQVHGSRLVNAAQPAALEVEVEADASFSQQAKVVCAIQMADCMPILFCDQAGTIVAAAHAGWRGLAGGVIEATVQGVLRTAGIVPAQLLVWLGPAIGPRAFEVGDDVVQAFTQNDPGAGACFKPHRTYQGKPGQQWWCDLEVLVRRGLAALGVRQVFGGGRCTVSEPQSFYSFRRDRITGRMAALIWLEA